MQFKQILKNLSKSKEAKDRNKLREILYKYKSRLPEQDFWLLEYTYLERLSPYNISMKFSMAESTYYQALKNAIGKLEVLLTSQEFREMFLLA
jgi:DNA-directed RNA polymerase specialized sigma subunit